MAVLCFLVGHSWERGADELRPRPGAPAAPAGRNAWLSVPVERCGRCGERREGAPCKPEPREIAVAYTLQHCPGELEFEDGGGFEQWSVSRTGTRTRGGRQIWKITHRGRPVAVLTHFLEGDNVVTKIEDSADERIRAHLQEIARIVA